MIKKEMEALGFNTELKDWVVILSYKDCQVLKA